MPLRDRHLRAHGDDEGLREQDVRHSQMRLCLTDLAQCLEAHAVRCALHPDLRLVVLAQHLAHRHLGTGGGVRPWPEKPDPVRVIEPVLEARGVRIVSGKRPALSGDENRPAALAELRQRLGVVGIANDQNERRPLLGIGARTTGTNNKEPYGRHHSTRHAGRCRRACGHRGAHISRHVQRQHAPR